METSLGDVISIHPLGSLRKQADLVFYDGPILSLFENGEGDPYLYLWCDVDSRVNRWLVFRVSSERLSRYLERRATLRELLLNPADGFVYVADIGGDLRVVRVAQLSPRELPPAYLPASDSLYDFAPTNTTADVASIARRYGAPVLDIHLVRGPGIRFGAAEATVLGSLLTASGELSQQIALSLFAPRGQASVLSRQQALLYGSLEFVTHRAASFSAILRPVSSQASFPGFQDRTSQVVDVMLSLLINTREYEALKLAVRTYRDSVIRSLETLLYAVEQHQTYVEYRWASAEGIVTRSAQLDAYSARAILNNIERLDSEDATEFWAQGVFLGLDLKLHTYRFLATGGRESNGHFDPRIAYPLTHVSFETEYRVYVLRKLERRGGREKLRVIETIGVIEPLAGLSLEL